MTNTYSNRRRLALSLQQPTSTWTNGFGWDLAGRLTNVTSQAGAFGYIYTALLAGSSGRLVQELSLPSVAYVTNYFDPAKVSVNDNVHHSERGRGMGFLCLLDAAAVGCGRDDYLSGR